MQQLNRVKSHKSVQAFDTKTKQIEPRDFETFVTFYTQMVTSLYILYYKTLSFSHNNTYNIKNTKTFIQLRNTCPVIILS